MKIDIIIPTYNEEGSINKLYETLSSTLDGIKYNLIFVNDGSIDKTDELLNDIYNKDKKHVKVINFSRNFGKDAAIYAGLLKSTATYTAIIDADMQQHPKYILEMINILDKDSTIDEVAMVNKYDNLSCITKFAKKAFYQVMKWLSGLNFKVGASDFRVFRKGVRKAILNMSEKNRFTKGMFSWVGFNIKYLDYNADKRINGKSKFKITKQIKYAKDGIVGYSTKPLSMLTVLGSVIMFITFIIFIISLFKLDFNIYNLLLLLIFLFVGIILFVLGIISEYISKIYVETKNRPIYIEKDTLGFDEDIL